MAAGRLIGIATRPASRAPMVAHERRRVSVACGVEGDFRGKPGRRQVTVLAREAWEAACADVGRELGWTTRHSPLACQQPLHTFDLD